MCFIKRGVQPTFTTTKICLYLGYSNCFRFCKMSMVRCDLSDKILTYKVVFWWLYHLLLELQVIHQLDVRYMLRPEGNFVFTFHKLHKSWKYRKAPPSLKFCEYTEERDICVVTTLNEYIKRAYQRRAETDALNYCWALFSYMWKCLEQLSLQSFL